MSAAPFGFAGNRATETIRARPVDTRADASTRLDRDMRALAARSPFDVRA